MLTNKLYKSIMTFTRIHLPALLSSMYKNDLLKKIRNLKQLSPDKKRLFIQQKKPNLQKIKIENDGKNETQFRTRHKSITTAFFCIFRKPCASCNKACLFDQKLLWLDELQTPQICRWTFHSRFHSFEGVYPIEKPWDYQKKT